MATNPLVSVLVVTYNSAEYIIETLDSIKAQTYANLELVLTDDGSADSTIPLAEQWIADNKTRFVETKIITVKKNTGVSANYNRGVQACNGEWIKNVDGDDLITANCISDNVEYATSHHNINVLFSDMYLYVPHSNEYRVEPYTDTKELFNLANQNNHEQTISIAIRNFLPSQTCFIRASVLKSHPYNESYQAIEDYPKWLELSKSGYRFDFMNKKTAIYRKCESTTASNSRFYSEFYMDSFMQFYWSELYPFLKSENLIVAVKYYKAMFIEYELTLLLFKNKRNFITRTARKLIRLFIASRI